MFSGVFNKLLLPATIDLSRRSVHHRRCGVSVYGRPFPQSMEAIMIFFCLPRLVYYTGATLKLKVLTHF